LRVANYDPSSEITTLDTTVGEVLAALPSVYFLATYGDPDLEEPGYYEEHYCPCAGYFHTIDFGYQFTFTDDIRGSNIVFSGHGLDEPLETTPELA